MTLLEEGVRICEVARRMGVAYSTVQHWRRNHSWDDKWRAPSACPKGHGVLKVDVTQRMEKRWCPECLYTVQVGL